MVWYKKTRDIQMFAIILGLIVIDVNNNDTIIGFVMVSLRCRMIRLETSASL